MAWLRLIATRFLVTYKVKRLISLLERVTCGTRLIIKLFRSCEKVKRKGEWWVVSLFEQNNQENFSVRIFFSGCMQPCLHEAPRVNKLFSHFFLFVLRLTVSSLLFTMSLRNLVKQTVLNKSLSFEADNVQGQTSEHIFAPNLDYCVYYPSNLFCKTRIFENWGIFNSYSASVLWIWDGRKPMRSIAPTKKSRVRLPYS